MILILPHPFTFTSHNARPPQPQPQPHQQAQEPSSPRAAAGGFRRGGMGTGSNLVDYLRARYVHQPLEGFSQWISPTARVYQGLTPQFKVFLQMSVMILGGVVWAERRVTEYIDFMRKVKRVQRVQAERESNLR